MLKFNIKEINVLYEGLNSLLGEDKHNNEQIIDLMNKLKETGKVQANSLNENLNEYYQIEDTVRLHKQRGFIIGEIEGKKIVMIQGSTFLVDDKELTEYHKKADLVTLPHMKFDEDTQKLLFEQYVRCAVYMNNVPIKLTDCYVKYSSWEKAVPSQQIKVLVEGNTTFIAKEQVRIYEDLNVFANPDNYVPGVIIDETNEDALENVLINAIDYSNAIGDADPVSIIRKTVDGTQEMQSLPRASLRTLAV